MWIIHVRVFFWLGIHFWRVVFIMLYGVRKCKPRYKMPALLAELCQTVGILVLSWSAVALSSFVTYWFTHTLSEAYNDLNSGASVTKWDGFWHVIKMPLFCSFLEESCCSVCRHGVSVVLGCRDLRQLWLLGVYRGRTALRTSKMWQILSNTLPLHSPASHIYHSISAQWHSQVMGTGFQSCTISHMQKGFLTVPDLLPCFAVKVHSCRFWLLCSSLCSAWGRPHFFYSWLCCRNCRVLMEPSKAGEGGWWWTQGSWKQTAGLTVVSLSPCGDNSLPFAAIPPYFGIVYASWAFLLLSTLLCVG